MEKAEIEFLWDRYAELSENTIIRRLKRFSTLWEKKTGEKVKWVFDEKDKIYRVSSFVSDDGEVMDFSFECDFVLNYGKVSFYG